MLCAVIADTHMPKGDRRLPKATRVSGQRRYGEDVLRRLEVIEVAKRAGFSLDEARVLLDSTDAGAPVHEAIRTLAARKLPEVDALIERAQAMSLWLEHARDCDCGTLDACALVDVEARPAGFEPATSASGGQRSIH